MIPWIRVKSTTKNDSNMSYVMSNFKAKASTI